MAEMSTQNGTVAFSDDTVGTTTVQGWDTENTPVVAVVTAVANASGEDPLELPPLRDAIDPEALNTIFTSGSESSVERVSFQYAGYSVVVRGSGTVQIGAVHDV